jgi:hypothetical protein
MELWTVTELRSYCRALGIATSGRKSELIARIIQRERETPHEHKHDTGL